MEDNRNLHTLHPFISITDEVVTNLSLGTVRRTSFAEIELVAIPPVPCPGIATKSNFLSNPFSSAHLAKASSLSC